MGVWSAIKQKHDIYVLTNDGPEKLVILLMQMYIETFLTFHIPLLVFEVQ